MSDSTKPQIALVGSYSDAFVKALQDEDFEVEQCDSVPNPTTKTPSFTALALKGEEYTLSESDITLMLPAKTVLIFFGPTSTLLETVQSATNTPIDIPSLKLVDGLPLLVYMVDGMVTIATNNLPDEAKVLPLVQSAIEGDDSTPQGGFQLTLPSVDPVEQAVLSISTAVAATKGNRGYVSNLDPPTGVIGFKRGTLSNTVRIAVKWLAWSPSGEFSVQTTDSSLIQKYAWNWSTDVYAYATGADPRGKTSDQFTSEGGVVYTVVIDRGNMQRAADSAPRYWGPHPGYCGYYFVDVNMTGHHPGSSLQMRTYQPRGTVSQTDKTFSYDIDFQQAMQMFNNNGNSTYTFNAQYSNSFTLNQFEIHQVPNSSTGGVDFSVDYNGYYNRWADPNFTTDQWYSPGVFEEVYRDGWEHWVVRGDLPADNVPINGLIVFSSSVGKHTLTSKCSTEYRAFKSNCWQTSTDEANDIRFQTIAGVYASNGSTRTMDLSWA